MFKLSEVLTVNSLNEITQRKLTEKKILSESLYQELMEKIGERPSEEQQLQFLRVKKDAEARRKND